MTRLLVFVWCLTTWSHGAIQSSVYCWGQDHLSRICEVRNLCYRVNVGRFVVYNVTTAGVPINRFDPTLCEVSGLANHSYGHFNFVELPKDEGVVGRSLLNGNFLFMRRFLPDNLMHIFHDDLLPIFATNDLLRRMSNINLTTILIDDYDGFGPFEELYSGAHLLKDLTKDQDEVCFSAALIGLNRVTSWYQYGFYQPQGPITNPMVTFALLQQFREDLLNRRDMTGVDSRSDCVVLSRKSTRLILNERELLDVIVSRLKCKVLVVSLETHSLQQIINSLRAAKIVVGMHGSLLVLSLFMQPTALLLELFPYAVLPELYTPYRTLAKLMKLRYATWVNVDPDRTVAHPERPASLGGIAHLSKGKRSEIERSQQLKPHLCCSDPAWLYRIYQDTTVNTAEIATLLEEITASNSSKELTTTSQLAPDQPEGLKCSISNGHLRASWSRPWNVPVSFEVRYEVVVEFERHSIKEVVNGDTRVDFSLSLTGSESSYPSRLFVRSSCGDLYGPFSSCDCSPL